jgi:hypothetical protein
LFGRGGSLDGQKISTAIIVVEEWYGGSGAAKAAVSSALLDLAALDACF